MLAYKQYWMLL